MKNKLFLATDHAGFEHKNFLRDYMLSLDSFEYEVVDLGAFVFDENDDYPDYIARAAREVGWYPDLHRAVVFGGSGQGEAIVANKHNGVRATVYYGHEESVVSLGREHNNTNVLAIGARFVVKEDLPNILHTWLESHFDVNSRHQRRLALIQGIEERRFWRRFLSFVRNI